VGSHAEGFVVVYFSRSVDAASLLAHSTQGMKSEEPESITLPLRVIAPYVSGGPIVFPFLLLSDYGYPIRHGYSTPIPYVTAKSEYREP
jgi:hypothetical protein